MLILTRKAGESILIGDNLEIKVLEIYDGRIKIGIDAPRDVKVLRKEVLATIDENIEASRQQVSKEKLEKLLEE